MEKLEYNPEQSLKNFTCLGVWVSEKEEEETMYAEKWAKLQTNYSLTFSIDEIVCNNYLHCMDSYACTRECAAYMWLWLSIRRYFCIRNENVMPKTVVEYTNVHSEFECTLNIRSFWFSIEAHRYNVDRVHSVYDLHIHCKHHSHTRIVVSSNSNRFDDFEMSAVSIMMIVGWLGSLTSVRKSLWNSFGCLLSLVLR